MATGPERSGRISEQLMTGQLSIVAFFSSGTEGSLTSPAIKTFRSAEGHSAASPAENTVAGELQDTRKQIHEITRNVSKVLAQQEELTETLNSSLKDLKAIAATAEMVEGIRNCHAELLAKYDSLVTTTGRLTATAAASEASLEEQGSAPTVPSLYKVAVLEQLYCDKDSRDPDVKSALHVLDEAYTLREETFAKPQMSARDFANLLYGHLPGNDTPFHQLAQVIAKIAKRSEAIDICDAEFQASLAHGASPQEALVQMIQQIPCLKEASPPEVEIKSQTEIPQACQKSLRALPPHLRLGQGWICVYCLPDGKKLGLKV